MFSSNLTPLIHLSLSRVRGGPSVSVGHKKGRADREEPGRRNKAVWWGGKRKAKGALKLTALSSSKKWHQHTQDMNGDGLEEIQGLQKKREGSKGPVVPRSSQVNVLQLEQQSTGG